MRGHWPWLLGLALSPASARALTIWTNQVGFDPLAPKVARVADGTTAADAGGSFAVRSRVGETVLSGSLVLIGEAWGSRIWRADFSALQTPGEYTLTATLGAESKTSDPIVVAADVLFARTAALAVEYFALERCGVGVPGYHDACHTDDGQLPDGTRRDVTGGWHDAGDYNKFTGFYYPHALYALVAAYETRPRDFAAFDARDRIGFSPNGVPDIVDEAMFGADFLVKMTDPVGHLPMGVRLNRSGSSFVRPEQDSDRVRGTSDDRLIFEEEWQNGQAGIGAAALAKLARLLDQDPLLPPAPPEYLEAAKRIWSHYWELEWPGHLYGSDLSQVLAAVELYRATGESTYLDYLALRAGQLGAELAQNPGIHDSDCMTAGAHAAILLEAVALLPDLDQEGTLRAGALALVDRLAEQASTPPGIITRTINDQVVYFPPYEGGPGLTLGLNSTYASVAWAAHRAFAATGAARYLELAQQHLDWILGANPERICMMTGAGVRNVAGYHNRYYKIPGHEDGAVAGAVINGYVRDEDNPSVDAPWIDLEPNSTSLLFGRLASFRSNEPWLPNNGYFLLALVTAPHTPVPMVEPEGPRDGEGDGGPLPADTGPGDGSSVASGDAAPASSDPAPPEPGAQPAVDPFLTGSGCACEAATAPHTLWAAAVAACAQRRRRGRATRAVVDRATP